MAQVADRPAAHCWLTLRPQAAARRGRIQGIQMDEPMPPIKPGQLDDLAEALADRLATRGHTNGIQLLDLMRTEQNLLDALGVIRRQIAAIVRAG